MGGVFAHGSEGHDIATVAVPDGETGQPERRQGRFAIVARQRARDGRAQPAERFRVGAAGDRRAAAGNAPNTASASAEPPRARRIRSARRGRSSGSRARPTEPDYASAPASPRPRSHRSGREPRARPGRRVRPFAGRPGKLRQTPARPLGAVAPVGRVGRGDLVRAAAAPVSPS